MFDYVFFNDTAATEIYTLSLHDALPILVAEADAPPALVDQLNAISARWRGKHPERGFTMSLSPDVRGAGADPRFLLCVAEDADGRAGGFLPPVPAYGPSFGFTLALMPHDPDAPDGMNGFRF